MNTTKKLVISAGWLVIVPLMAMLFATLRHIGTTWTSNPGFFRLIALSLFGLVCIVAPLLLSALIWIGQPTALYRKFK